MAINKICSSLEEAVADIQNGAVIMIAGFAGSGTPQNLIRALTRKGVKDLTLVGNSFNNFLNIEDAKQVRKVISSYPYSPFRTSRELSSVEKGVIAKEIEVEITPQGTLVERIRAGGAGIAAFYTPVGIGTVVEEGKEKRIFNAREYILEQALTADFAFIKAYKADRMGNLVYRMAMRNFNPIMATAARVTIAEVEEIVPVGELDPEVIVTPGVFVQCVVQAVPEATVFRIPPRRTA